MRVGVALEIGFIPFQVRRRDSGVSFPSLACLSRFFLADVVDILVPSQEFCFSKTDFVPFNYIKIKLGGQGKE